MNRSIKCVSFNQCKGKGGERKAYRITGGAGKIIDDMIGMMVSAGF